MEPVNNNIPEQPVQPIPVQPIPNVPPVQATPLPQTKVTKEKKKVKPWVIILIILGSLTILGGVCCCGSSIIVPIIIGNNPSLGNIAGLTKPKNVEKFEEAISQTAETFPSYNFETVKYIIRANQWYDNMTPEEKAMLETEDVDKLNRVTKEYEKEFETRLADKFGEEKKEEIMDILVNKIGLEKKYLYAKGCIRWDERGCDDFDVMSRTPIRDEVYDDSFLQFDYDVYVYDDGHISVNWYGGDGRIKDGLLYENGTVYATYQDMIASAQQFSKDFQNSWN